MSDTSQTPQRASIQSCRPGDGLSINWCKWCGEHLDARGHKGRNFCSAECVEAMLGDARERAEAIRKEAASLRQLSRIYRKRGW